MITRISCVALIVMVSACAMQTQRSSETQGGVASKRNLPQYREAIDAAKEGDTLKAISLLQKVTKANPDFSIAHTDLGLQYLRENDLDKAEKSFEKSISLDSANFVAYNHRGVILRKRGDFSGAEKMYKEAISHKSDYANAHLNIAVLYDIYLYDHERAMSHYKRYQSLTNSSDKLVAKWVVDLERQISAKNKGKK